VLLSRAILCFGLNFYVPISKVDENMTRAHVRDAARTGKFFFRKDVFAAGHLRSASPSIVGSAEGRSPTISPLPGNSDVPCLPCQEAARGTNHAAHDSDSDASSLGPLPPLSKPGAAALEELRLGKHKESRLMNCFPAVPKPPEEELNHRVSVEEEYEEMTMDEIMNGKGDFPGLLGLVLAYLDSLDVDFKAKQRLRKYLNLVKRRADGTLITTASWMRSFIRAHPAYKFDSVVSQEINYDLIRAVDEIEQGLREVPDLLPEDYASSRRCDDLAS